MHLDDDIARVPEAQRATSRVFRSRPAAPAPAVSGPTEGAFASAIAREVGLLRSDLQDPVSVLQIVGIYPTTGWHPADALSPAVVDEVVGAARAAARGRRLRASEATVEAAVLRVASSLGVAGPAPAAPPDLPPAPEPAVPIVVAPSITVESPPVVVRVVERPPRPVLSGYPTFAYGVPFAPFTPRVIGPIPDRITPLSSPAGRLHGPLVTPLRPPGRFTRPMGF